MNTKTSIIEKFTLPSKGLIYDNPINSEVTLRSMTTMDELIRLSPSTKPYSFMASLIQSCIVGELGMDVEDLCLADYQFLLHKLRIITYGPEYPMMTRCPFCGKIEDQVINLDELECVSYTDEMKELFTIHLPVYDVDVKLNYSTPRMLDRILERKQEILDKNPEALDPTFILTLQELIDKVDGQTLSRVKLEGFVQNMNMKDANLIIRQSDKINQGIGLDLNIVTKCSHCGLDYVSTFRETSEFLRPTLY